MEQLSNQFNNQIYNAILFTIISLLTSQITNILNLASGFVQYIVNYIWGYFISFDSRNYEVIFNQNITKNELTNDISGCRNYYLIEDIIEFYLKNNEMITNHNKKYIDDAEFQNNIIFDRTDYDILYNDNIINIKRIKNLSINEQKVTTLKASITLSSKISIKHIQDFISDFNNKLKISKTINPVYYYFCNPIDKYMKPFELPLYKTFNDIYIPEKEQIKLLLNKLDNKELRNLGLLLHGEGGTGKTSLIKIIANVTKRHVINIKLSNINDLEELLSIFFHKHLFMNQNSHIEVPLNKRLYIFEDIDAETDVVFKRSENETCSQPDFSVLKNTDIGEEKIDKLISSWKNKLKLADLLNIFDGILELHDTIYIITTNHPDKLDPALIRPGRINMKIELKKMLKSEMMKMISYKYRNKETNQNLENFQHVFDFVKDYTWTPAQIEEFIYESDTIKILSDRLRKETKVTQDSFTKIN